LSYVIEFCDLPALKDRVFEKPREGLRRPEDLLYLNGTHARLSSTLQQKGFKFLNRQAAQRMRLRRVLSV